MARSNSNQDRTGGQAARPARGSQPAEPGLPWHPGAQAHVAPQDPQFAGYDVPPTGRPQTGPAPAQLPWPQAGQFTQQQPPPPPPPPQHYAPQQAYGNPQQGYPPPAYPPQSYQQQPAAYPAESHNDLRSDPRNGHYFPQQQPEQQAYPGPAAYHEPAPQLRGSYPGHGQAYGEPTFAPPPQNGYPAHYQQQSPGPDTSGYELGAYATQTAVYGEPHAGRGQPLPLPHAYANEYSQPAQPEPGFAPPRGAAAPVADADEDFDDEDYVDDEDEEPRRFGVLKIVASLAVAIAIGAGGAFAYKKFGVAPSANRSQTAQVAPVKLQAANADAGRGSDSKSGERVSEPIPAVVPANDGNGDSPSGTRRVQTIPIMPAGAAPSQTPPQPPMRPTISVPGVALGDMAIAPPQPQAPPQPVPSALPPVTPAPVGRAVAPPPATPQRAPVAPKVIAAVEDPAVTAAKAAPKAPVAKAIVAKAPKSNDAYAGGAPSAVGAVNVATATTTPAPAPAAKVASNGYVAVLASQGSAIDARKTLDDLQGKYGDVLGGKPTDVTEFANPKNGKTYYRAIVGPPGSREAAANVCTQVRAAGHKDCFAAAY